MILLLISKHTNTKNHISESARVDILDDCLAADRIAHDLISEHVRQRVGARISHPYIYSCTHVMI